jgi:pSer/pThr/pTyr-binding forkhead associated (FHA) protein
VAGAAALVWSAFPDYTADQVRDYLQTHALDLGSPGPDNGFGYGRLRLPEPPSAVVEAPVVPTAVPTLAPLPTAVPEATVVARLPEPVEKLPEEGASRAVSPLVVGGLGVCGGLLFLGGGGLLLVALWRSSRRPTRTVTPQRTAAPPSWEMRRPAPDRDAGYGSLSAPGMPAIWLRPGAITLGRAAGNDVVLDSMLVSRSHARIECAAGRCMVQDLGSANGLFVNGRRTSQAVLSTGDRLGLGDVELVYQGGGAPRQDAWEQPTAAGQMAARGQTNAWLEIGGRQVSLSTSGASLGRAQDNDVHVPDEHASRHHARIDVQQGAYVISDLGSANGTFVNNQRIQRQALRDGDEIRIGDTVLRFRSG